MDDERRYAEYLQYVSDEKEDGNEPLDYDEDWEDTREVDIPRRQ